MNQESDIRRIPDLRTRSDSRPVLLGRFLYGLFVTSALGLLSACVTSPEIDTPREVIQLAGVDIPAGDLEFAIELDGRPQYLRLHPDDVVCRLDQGQNPRHIQLQARLSTDEPDSREVSIVHLALRTGVLRVGADARVLQGNYDDSSHERAVDLELQTPINQDGTTRNDSDNSDNSLGIVNQSAIIELFEADDSGRLIAEMTMQVQSTTEGEQIADHQVHARITIQLHADAR